MPRHLSLRQIEAFKAIIEHGTVSRAAEMLGMSQPAMSKLIAYFEYDTGLELFDRIKGRLAPTARGMRLYEEVDRIFAGVRQVENAVDAIRREDQGQLMIGVMPALSGAFIRQVTVSFLAEYPQVFCSLQSRSSQWISDFLITRKLDIGFVTSRIDNPYLESEPLIAHPLVCVMPLSHRLAARNVITPADLDREPFVAFDQDSYTAQRIANLCTAHGVQPRIAMVANVSPTLCEFVAAGVGVSLLHPLMASGFRDRLAIRRFEPEMSFDFQLCRARESRSSKLVSAFLKHARQTAQAVTHEMLVHAR